MRFNLEDRTAVITATMMIIINTISYLTALVVLTYSVYVLVTEGISFWYMLLAVLAIPMGKVLSVVLLLLACAALALTAKILKSRDK